MNPPCIILSAAFKQTPKVIYIYYIYYTSSPFNVFMFVWATVSIRGRSVFKVKVKVCTLKASPSDLPPPRSITTERERELVNHSVHHVLACKTSRVSESSNNQTRSSSLLLLADCSENVLEMRTIVLLDRCRSTRQPQLQDEPRMFLH